MNIDWRNLLIVGHAGALLWVLWEQVRLRFLPPPLGAVSMFPESRLPEGVDFNADGATAVGTVPAGPRTRFYGVSVRAEGISGDTRTGTVIAMFDLMGSKTQ